MNAPEWQVLDEAELGWLGSVALSSSYESGQYIFYEGDKCDGIHFVCRGLIGVRKINADGDSVLMHMAEQGDPLGYRPFLDEKAYYSTAEALQPSQLCFIGAKYLRDIFHRSPDFSFEFLRRASRDLGESRERFHQAVSMDLRLRLAHFLLLMKERYGHVTHEGKLLIELPISRRDMAEMIGVRSESLSRTIRQMTDEGVLTFSGHRVWIDTADLLISEIRPGLDQYPRH
ncbi:MAG: Crp/Fnr family transcriptional regulator [Halocynthiibacter sp.]